MKDLFIMLLATCSLHTISTQNDVRLPPTIRLSPESKVIKFYKIYDNITLECRAVGTPAVRYEWKKNGFQLNTNFVNIHRGSDGTITINRATEHDEGYYQCFAQNQYGTALSDIIDIRMAFIESSPATFDLLQQTVVEGMPFQIQAHRQRSFPEPLNHWVKKMSKFKGNVTHIYPSERMQFADNGDLYFAYALSMDADGDRLYWSFANNSFLNVSKWGEATQLTVTRNPEGFISEFAPTLAFSSPLQPVVVLIGGSATFRCFFYGYPAPKISWSLPTSATQSGRIQRPKSDAERTIRRVTASDEGECNCTGSNTQGNTSYTFKIRIEAAPKFQNTKNGLNDVNVTEGESVTFNCNASAKPEASIVWLQNGHPINTTNPPKRFAFGNGLKSLTIRDVCRDCVDRESKTDLMVIQCNASNVHGFAFAQGYLNVLMKTKVSIRAPTKVSTDFQEEKKFIFQCHVTSDPDRPATVRWYKAEPLYSLVRDEPPYVRVTNDSLIISIDPECSAHCAKYLGEYKCVGDNGYSQDNQTISLAYQPSTELPAHKEESWAVWKIILVLGAIICIVLLLVGIFLKFRLRQRFCCNQPMPFAFIRT